VSCPLAGQESNDSNMTFLAFEVALATTVLTRPYLARALFGWQPKKIGLTDGLDVYYSAFQATLQ
jgi:hypothetical protein